MTQQCALQALGRFKVGQMNKTEAAYAATLAQRQHAGEAAWFKFEGLKIPAGRQHLLHAGLRGDAGRWRA